DTLNNGASTTGVIEIIDYDNTNFSGANGYYYRFVGVKEAKLNASTNWLGYRKFQKFDGSGDDQPERVMLTESYVEDAFGTTTKPVPGSISADDKTSYSYTFHDTAEQKLATKTITYPKVGTSENGSGVAVSVKFYYDDAGRLRWSKDGEGNINYYAYHPNTGGLAYVMRDVETDDLPTDITAGSSGKWIEWDDGSSGDTIPTGFTNTDNDNLQLVTRSEYDDLGRLTRIEDAEGMVTYMLYLDHETRIYAGWNTGTNKPELPIVVTETNHAGDVTSIFSIDPAGVTVGHTGGVPNANDTGLTQDDYITWTTYDYDDTNGQLIHVDRYHDIPSSGSGTIGTNFYRTEYVYDAMGRRTHVSQLVKVATDRFEQVTKFDYDVLSRVTATYHDYLTNTVGDSYNYVTHGGYEKRAAIHYDEATPGSGTSGVGDSVVTSRTSFSSADESVWVKTHFHRNWRHQLRGIEIVGDDGTTEASESPYLVQDVDNLGRVTAVASYDKAPTSWSTVTGDADYAATILTHNSGYRRSLSQTYYDNAGFVYQTEAYEVTSTSGAKGNAIITESYRDRNGRVVATESSGGGAAEFAYDGVGRLYQTRALTELETTKYASGAFAYRDPVPDPALSSMTGGDDKVIALAHSVFDKVGNVIESLSLEMLHDDTTNVGIDLGSDDDYIQTSVYAWYDDVHRRTTAVNYGTSDSEFKYASPTARPGTAPTA
ncbi:MAG: hypothetical protein MI741_08805, partial [Rhodospirillales bacterium]|nr:hypothetical protein [Rhodospirillales bacterium]